MDTVIDEKKKAEADRSNNEKMKELSANNDFIRPFASVSNCCGSQMPQFIYHFFTSIGSFNALPSVKVFRNTSNAITIDIH